LAFLVGLLTGLTATLINLAIENIAGYKLLAVVHLIRKKRFDDIPLGSDHHFIFEC
jgi:chloride channel 7